MTALIAHGSVMGGDSPWMLIWFGMLIVGILFIALALRGDKRTSEEDDSIPDLQDRRDLPLRNVATAIRSTSPRPRPASKSLSHRGTSRPGGPRGLVR